MTGKYSPRPFSAIRTSRRFFPFDLCWQTLTACLAIFQRVRIGNMRHRISCRLRMKAMLRAKIFVLFMAHFITVNEVGVRSHGNTQPCSRFFFMTHNKIPGGYINHPIRNLNISRNIHLNLFYFMRVASKKKTTEKN